MALPGGSRVTLTDGHTMPVLGLGTYAASSVPKSVGEEATKVAIELGYRHIDCAPVYGNETEIGHAIRAKIADGTVKREDMFVTSKLWCTNFSPGLVRKGLEKSMNDLQLDYLDLYIMHYPLSIKPSGESLKGGERNQDMEFDDIDFCDTWEALEACKDAGLVRSIGVSNFNHRQLQRLLSKPGLKYKPVCNQVECHPYLTQKRLLEFCKSKDIVVVGYSVLGSHRDPNWVDLSTPVLLEDPVLIEIGKKIQRSSAEVAMRFVLQSGVVVLAKSFRKERLKQNLQVFDFELTPEDMKTIEALNRNLRYGLFIIMKDHPEYPYHDEY